MGIGGHAAEAWAGNSFYREPSCNGSSPANRVNPLGELGRPVHPQAEKKTNRRKKKKPNI